MNSRAPSSDGGLLRSWEAALFLGVPLAILLLSYIGICLEVGSLWPGAALIHESGRRTLIETIFWFEHGVREIPIDLLLGLAIAASVLRFSQATPVIDAHRRSRVMWWAGGLLILLTVLIVTGAAMSSGLVVVIEEFAQMHTRPDSPPAWGSHWDSHLLSRAALILAAIAVGGFHAALKGQSKPFSSVGTRVYAISVATFVLITIFLGPNLMPVLDPIHIGHQARELATHLFVTLPVSFGLGLLAIRYQAGQQNSGASSLSTAAIPGVFWMGALGVIVIGAYLTVGFLLTEAHGLGQSNSLVALVLVHFFEHLLTYLFTPLWVIFLCAWLGTSARATKVVAR
jgi:hypothetical protein